MFQNGKEEGTWLVTGASGMLGRAFCTLWGERCVGLSRVIQNHIPYQTHMADIRDRSRLAEIFELVRPTICFHFAANTDLIDCERNPSQAYDTNCTATEHISGLCKNYQARMCYMSTDSVFDGRFGNYEENDKPNPLNSYAKTKLAGEEITLSQNQCNLVFRGNIIGRDPTGKTPFKLVDWIINQLHKRQPINGFTDVIFNPLSVITMSRNIAKLATSSREGGIWHLGSKSPLSKYDFVSSVAKQVGLTKTQITPRSIDEFQLDPPRPKNTALNISKSVKFGLPEVSIESEIDTLFQHEGAK
jgi:dTDP-4-dehydrorhamnose reductase